MEHHKSVGEILRTYSSVELTHWMVFFAIQEEELQNTKSGTQVLKPTNPDQEMKNVMRVLGIRDED